MVSPGECLLYAWDEWLLAFCCCWSGMFVRSGLCIMFNCISLLIFFLDVPFIFKKWVLESPAFIVSGWASSGVGMIQAHCAWPDSPEVELLPHECSGWKKSTRPFGCACLKQSYRTDEKCWPLALLWGETAASCLGSFCQECSLCILWSSSELVAQMPQILAIFAKFSSISACKCSFAVCP